jgi:hypothetical protein
MARPVNLLYKCECRQTRIKSREFLTWKERGGGGRERKKDRTIEGRYRDTETQRHRDTDTETEQQSNKETKRQRDRAGNINPEQSRVAQLVI